MRKVLALICLSALVGCTTAPVLTGNPVADLNTNSNSVNSNLAQIGTFTTADLTAAEADAVANGDTLAIPCYPALAAWVATMKPLTPVPTSGAGAFLVHQQARDVGAKLQAATGTALVPSAVKLACAALVQSDAVFLANLAALGAVGATAAPMLPALGAALPIPLVP
jgi:hypothetical protein